MEIIKAIIQVFQETGISELVMAVPVLIVFLGAAGVVVNEIYGE